MRPRPLSFASPRPDRRDQGQRHQRQRPDVTVLDRDHHLFTLQDDRDINVELYVNHGRGYVEADQHVVDRTLPVDLVRIDSIYNPVRRCNFAVDETRVGQRTDYDRLTLTVETNGTITPEEAVSYAAALAQTHFQYFAGFGSHTSAPITAGQRHGRQRRSASGAAALARRSKISSSPFAPSTRSRTPRSAHSAISSSAPRSQILQVKNFGKKSLNEIAELLERENLNFGMKFEESEDGVRITDRGTPPNRTALAEAAIGDDDE